MKRILVFSVLILALFASCKKKENSCPYTTPTVVAPASEVQAVQQYLTTNSITATQDPSGFFYTISAPGTGTKTPGLCSNVGVRYKGTLTNGNVFDDSGTEVRQFTLGQLITAWQKAIPMLKAGGKMRLYIPPSLGYGPNPVKDGSGTVVIPGNSILIFDIELVIFD